MGIQGDSQRFGGVESMGFLRVLRDFAKILRDSWGFSGFPRKLYEVSGVSSPSDILIFLSVSRVYFLYIFLSFGNKYYNFLKFFE